MISKLAKDAEGGYVTLGPRDMEAAMTTTTTATLARERYRGRKSRQSATHRPPERARTTILSNSSSTLLIDPADRRGQHNVRVATTETTYHYETGPVIGYSVLLQYIH